MQACTYDWLVFQYVNLRDVAGGGNVKHSRQTKSNSDESCSGTAWADLDVTASGTRGSGPGAWGGFVRRDHIL